MIVANETLGRSVRFAFLVVGLAVVSINDAIGQGVGDPRAEPPGEERQVELRKTVLRAFPLADNADQGAVAASIPKILQMAAEENTSTGPRFALLLEARKRAMSVGDAESYQSAVALQTARFNVGPWKTTSEAYVAFAKERPAGFLTSRLVADSCQLAIDHADGGQLEQSIRFLEAVWKAVKSTKGHDSRKDMIKDLGSELFDQRSLLARYDLAVATLQKDADDPDANLIVGQRLAIDGKAWPKALECFQRCGEETFRSAAEAELANKDAATVADAWAEAIAAVPPSSKLGDAIARHAIHWYELAKGLTNEPLDQKAFQNSIDKLKAGLKDDTDGVREKISSTKRASQSKRDLLRKFGGTEETQASVSLGLKWLARNQARDGAWSLRGPYADGGTSESETAATAMALLAFLGDGQTHLEGQYTKAVRSGVDALIKTQTRDGFFARNARGNQKMYAQALATIAICKAYGITKDDWLRSRAQLAIDFAVDAQSPQGGWRYEPKFESDTSVTGWFVTALVEGQDAKLQVNEEVLKRVSGYLDTVASYDGAAYGYIAGKKNNSPSPAMTAAGLLCRRGINWDRDHKSVRDGIKALLTDALFDAKDRDVYYWYYATRLLRQQGGDSWSKWNEKMRDVLPATQVKKGKEAGSWSPQSDRWGTNAGRLFTTCFSIYCLQSYYDAPADPSEGNEDD